VTVQSYRESLFVGINACAASVPDPSGLAEAMPGELSLLCRMAAGSPPSTWGPGSAGAPRPRGADQPVTTASSSGTSPTD